LRTASHLHKKMIDNTLSAIVERRDGRAFGRGQGASLSVIIRLARTEGKHVGLLRRPRRRLIRRYPRRSPCRTAAAVFAATLDWARDQPTAVPACGALHAELRAAAGLEKPRGT